MIAQLCSILSLKGLDTTWHNTISESALLLSFKRLGQACMLGYRNPLLGSMLQTISFYITILLFAALTLPIFVNDKEGLALISLASALVWLIGTAIGGLEKRQANAIDILVLGYGFMNVIAACSSHYFAESVRGLAKVVVYLISYFLLTAQFSSDSRRKLILAGTLTLTGTLIAIYGLYQYKIGVPPLATWEDPSIEEKVTRIYATLNNPNLLAGYLIPIVPISAALSLAALVSKRWLIGFISTMAFLLLTIATLLTGSRGAYLGLFTELLALGAVFVSGIYKDRPAYRPLVLFCAVFIPVAMVFGLHFLPSFEQRLSSIFVGREHSSNSFRMNVWLSCLSMLKDSWWCGVGVGNKAFRLAYGLYMHSGFDALGTYCVPLEIAVETGVLGLATFISLVLTSLARAHLQFEMRKQSWHRFLTAGAVAALIGLLTHGLVDTVFFRPQVQFIFWLIIAMLVTWPNQNGNLVFGNRK